MIDAYEIGIQLALQDGVSAGLEAIGRELAEVDRAVAASNAGLIALTQTAQSAARAAASTVGRQAPAVAQPAREGAPQNEVRPAVQVGVPQQVAASTPAAQKVEPVKADAGTAPRVQRGDAGLGSGGNAQAAAAGVPEVIPAAAPTRDRDAVQDVSQPIAAPVGESAPVAPSLQQIVSVAPPAETQVRSSAQMREGGLAPAASSGATAAAIAPARQTLPMRASVAQATPPQMRRDTVVREVGGQGGASLNMPVNVAIPQAPAAPGLVAAQGMPGPMRGAGSSQRGVAPQPEPRERGEGGGGSVMLDGRLVGYWLTEQMARDAARPPGGTSFFDPRQSPAWTPSGAL